ncbi:MAG: PD40 domain-containing protein [Deltaproteobacteria bacterium]|nr:PD40 domain-containing protein [Deltaproteobacteria bacterium]
MRRSVLLVLFALPVVAAFACGEETTNPAFPDDASTSPPETGSDARDPSVDAGADADGSATDAGGDAARTTACRGEIVFLSQADGRSWKVLADGGNPTRVSPDDVTFSPTWILGCSRVMTVFPEAGTGMVIGTYTPDGGNTQLLRAGNDPAWDDVHQRIVFSGNSVNLLGLYSMQPDGGDLVTLGADDGFNYSEMAVSPDGTTIAVQHKSQLQLIENKASGALIRALPPCRFPAWNPDGKRLACTTIISPTAARIFVMDAVTGATSDLTTGAAFDVGAVWSPDGKELAFTRGPGPGSAGAEIHVMDADGSNIRKITSLEGANADWR